MQKNNFWIIFGNPCITFAQILLNIKIKINIEKILNFGQWNRAALLLDQRHLKKRKILRNIIFLFFFSSTEPFSWFHTKNIKMAANFEIYIIMPNNAICRNISQRPELQSEEEAHSHLGMRQVTGLMILKRKTYISIASNHSVF